MGKGIQDVYDGKAIIAYHSRADQSSLEAFPDDASWITLNWTYAYCPAYRERYPYEMNWVNWKAHPNTPIQFGEGYYDFGEDSRRARWGNRFVLRRQAWWVAFMPMVPKPSGDTTGMV